MKTSLHTIILATQAPNQALQRTRLRVTAPAPTTSFPPATQVPRRSGVSLSLRSFARRHRLPQMNDNQTRPYDWRAEHRRLWTDLVPASGQAPTVQGELIRAI